MDYLFFALTNPEEGREADFNEWYDRHHVREVLKYGNGFLNGRRYRLHPPPTHVTFPWTYLALYTLTSDDLRAHHQTPWITAKPPLTPFHGLLRDDHAAWIYKCASTDDDARRLSKGAEAFVLDLARIDPARDDDFRHWRDRHGRAMLTGFRGAIDVHDYVLAEHQRPSQLPSYWEHLTLYSLNELDRDRLDAVVTAVRRDAETHAQMGPWTERCVCAWTAISPCVLEA